MAKDSFPPETEDHFMEEATRDVPIPTAAAQPPVQQTLGSP